MTHDYLKTEEVLILNLSKNKGSETKFCYLEGKYKSIHNLNVIKQFSIIAFHIVHFINILNIFQKYSFIF